MGSSINAATVKYNEINNKMSDFNDNDRISVKSVKNNDETCNDNCESNVFDNGDDGLPTKCKKCSKKCNIRNVNENNLSRVQKFYNGKNVLITGATGFLGKILVEKLLRSCPGVENIYLLVRQKRGKDIYTRIEEIFDDPVFDRVRKEVPKFRHKIVVIPADCDAAGLGLTLADRQMLTEKVNIIFHSAATVKFDEHLKIALATNVRASLQLLRLAQDMKQLDVFMHISTAYSNSHLHMVEERYYPFTATSNQLEAMVAKMTDKELNDVLPKILGEWPNTYTFTKALAEKEMRANSNGLPIGIFRPAMVISTAKEPVKCWLDNINGPTGLAVGGATGMLRTFLCNCNLSAEIVPVDFVVNGLIVAAAQVSAAYKESNPPTEPPIFNYVNSVENRLTWGDFKTYNFRVLRKYPLANAIWYTSLWLTTSPLLYWIYTIILHIIPATLVDGLAICLGKEPKMLKMYEKIHKFSSLVSYFGLRDIKFCNRRTRQLWEQTSDDDKQIFPFSMATLDWPEYFEEYLHGIRLYLFKDSDDTLPRDRIRWKRLYYLHQSVKTTFYALIIYGIWYIFTRFSS